MHISYNRVSQVVWISDDDGNTVARMVTQGDQRCIDVARELLVEHEFEIAGDYLPEWDGSPVRKATIRLRNTAQASA